MIHLYTSKREIPQNRNFINDPDSYFDALVFSGKLVFDEWDKKILYKIDKSKLCDEDGYMNTPFGNHVQISHISTGAKTLILINHFKESVINISQCGRNVLEIAFNMDDTFYYLSYCIVPDKMKQVKVNKRQKVYKSSIDLLEIWRNKV